LNDLRLSAAQRQVLASIPHRLGVERIDRIWIFPPHPARTRETGLLAISLLPPPQHDTSHRTLLTVRYEADPAGGRAIRVADPTEEGSAPPDRINRVIAGVLARSSDPTGDPVLVIIEGDVERWREFQEQASLTDLTGEVENYYR
jgi:hypothetical protein